VATDPASSIRAVIFDLDGVLRHFDRNDHAAVERKHGLKPGAIAEVAFGHELLGALVTGKLTRQQWGDEVGQAIRSPDAARPTKHRLS